MCKDTHFDKTNNNDIIKLTYNCCNKHKSEEQPGNEPKPLLGIITKNSSPPPKDLQNHRAEKYLLRSVVSEIMPKSRTAKCMCWIMPGKNFVPVYLSKENQKAHYKNLMLCSSVWDCPVCAAKISEVRADQLTEATKRALILGLKIYLVTLTNGHGAGDDLKQLKELQKSVIKSMSSGKNTINRKLLDKGVNMVGFVRASEITYGKNGWHPHFHLLTFIESDLAENEVKNVLQNEYESAWVGGWSNLVQKHKSKKLEIKGIKNLNKLIPLTQDCKGKKVAVTVETGKSIAEYIAKYGKTSEKNDVKRWGTEREMTKGHIKNTRSNTSVTPWGLLRIIAGLNKIDGYNSERAKYLFKIYSNAYKGERQLFWSVGLKKMLLVDDLTDKEIVEKAENESNLLARLLKNTWKSIVREKKQSYYLNLAENDKEAFFNEIIKRQHYLFNDDQPFGDPLQSDPVPGDQPFGDPLQSDPAPGDQPFGDPLQSDPVPGDQPFGDPLQSDPAPGDQPFGDPLQSDPVPGDQPFGDPLQSDPVPGDQPFGDPLQSDPVPGDQCQGDQLFGKILSKSRKLLNPQNIF
jgi:hypothetical protein